jgi:hypothetical protein
MGIALKNNHFVYQKQGGNPLKPERESFAPFMSDHPSLRKNIYPLIVIELS